MIGFIVFGLVVGALARLVLPGDQHLGLLATLIVGLIGSVVGGVVANALGTGDVFELNVLGSIVAVISAAVLIIIADRLSEGGGRATA
ncbi:MAG: GlsB/YeaQ/YmgE family stress response membrane protein [Acidimicrobiales bacterium]|mgnify:CR=1 FL=1|nr:GlsB/YeaQ/YmgE family stress response membrane protein [Acidimicrobiales bacterium]HRW36444.1 GlsB/YeaQ/YmgE family stress response membrane protein [Aquihabitans sp.]